MTHPASVKKGKSMTKISAEELHRLLELHKAGSHGEWFIHRGLMAKDLNITTHWREGAIGDRKNADGAICHVSTERFVFHDDKFSNESRTSRKPIKNAEADAKLIVEAVNALPKLIAALSASGRCDETAWLIEWPADRHHPLRYYSFGEEPVMDHNEATRFARQVDAENAIKHGGLRGCKAVEHAWMAPTVPLERVA